VKYWEEKEEEILAGIEARDDDLHAVGSGAEASSEDEQDSAGENASDEDGGGGDEREGIDEGEEGSGGRQMVSSGRYQWDASLWVQCTARSCQKWRRGPRASIAEAKRDRHWVCSKNTWERGRAKCSAPEVDWRSYS